jgi:hypothetical protein
MYIYKTMGGRAGVRAARVHTQGRVAQLVLYIFGLMEHLPIV